MRPHLLDPIVVWSTNIYLYPLKHNQIGIGYLEDPLRRSEHEPLLLICLARNISLSELQIH